MSLSCRDIREAPHVEVRAAQRVPRSQQTLAPPGRQERGCHWSPARHSVSGGPQLLFLLPLLTLFCGQKA